MGVLPAFAGRFRTIAADAPGHGFSDKPDTHPYDVGSYVDATLGLMDTLGIAQAPAIAVSGAGTVALSIALAQPERISKLVLVDAAGLGRDVSWNYRLAALPLVRHAMRRSTRRQIEAFGRALCYTPDRLPKGWVDRRVQIWATPGAIEAFVKTARCSLGLRGQKVEFSGQLANLRQPTLIVWGRQDPIIPVAHGIAAARRIPNAHLRIFEHCGHMPVWEYPDEFVAAVLSFLDGAQR
jgi:4,5:9,10-diseco-3-hydroxy-5,9,17-trioxoandrosta-1(10),2-diene-4-oate hydrolase